MHDVMHVGDVVVEEENPAQTINKVEKVPVR
jgi:hypothetical protein